MIETRVIRIDPGRANAEEVRAIAASLREGAVAAYPTETFYALGAPAFSRKAVARIYRLKGRAAAKPRPRLRSGYGRGLFRPPGSLPSQGLWPVRLALVLPASPAVPLPHRPAGRSPSGSRPCRGSGPSSASSASR
jgi:L-threonylcarbamoyladenylate synthase